MKPSPVIAFAVAALPLVASAARADPVPMTAERWDVEGVAAFVEQDGRAAIRLGPAPGLPLKSGEAVLRGSSFSTGTVEFDLLASGDRDFVGLAFRAQEDGNGELFYIRPHMNGNPDSTQYTPVVNGDLAWQIFTGEGFTSRVRFDFGHWMHVRADIYADSALISVDGAPALAIPHLKTGYRSGLLALTSVAGAYFSNVSVTPIEGYRDPHPAPAPPPLPARIVGAWQVSPAMTEEDAMARAGRRDWTGVAWQRVPVESNGIDNLSRAGGKAEGKQTMIARFTLRAAALRTAAMHFGFSDSVHVFVNGRLVYAGDDAQGSRDYRFLGIVGFYDTLFLSLEPGANDVAFVVTEPTSGGWAAAARIDPDPAIEIE